LVYLVILIYHQYGDIKVYRIYEHNKDIKLLFSEFQNMAIQSIVSQNFIAEINFLIEAGEVKSIRQFAMEMGLTPSSISEIKAERQNVTTEILNKAARLYPSFSVARIFGEQQRTVMEVPTTDPITSMAQWMSQMERDIYILKEKIKSIESNNFTS